MIIAGSKLGIVRGSCKGVFEFITYSKYKIIIFIYYFKGSVSLIYYLLRYFF